MKKWMLCFGVLVSANAFAGDYVCQVYCVGPNGSTSVTVSAGSASDAAQIVDARSDKICQNAGHSRSTSQTMSASQCSRD